MYVYGLSPIFPYDFLEVELLNQRECVFFILIYIARYKKSSNLHFQVHCMSILKAWKTMGIIHKPDCLKKTQGRCSYFLNHLWDYLFKCSIAINIFPISCAFISFYLMFLLLIYKDVLHTEDINLLLIYGK